MGADQFHEIDNFLLGDNDSMARSANASKRSKNSAAKHKQINIEKIDDSASKKKVPY